jgi:hypothetical protein
VSKEKTPNLSCGQLGWWQKDPTKPGCVWQRWSQTRCFLISEKLEKMLLAMGEG